MGLLFKIQVEGTVEPNTFLAYLYATMTLLSNTNQ